MATITRCACGKRISQYARECAKCHKAEMQKIHAESQAIVAGGKCPDCGAGLRRNMSLAGWFQCEQYGAEGFRKDAAKPSCSFQCFTE